MSDKLTVVLNGQAVIEYDRAKALPEHQRAYLDKMDASMEQGIQFGSEQIANPDLQQKAQFVALELFRALELGDDARIAASCAYLANRLPDLKQVVGKSTEGQGVACDLVFDKAFVQEAALQFMKPN